MGYSNLYILIDFRYCEEVNKTNKVEITIILKSKKFLHFFDKKMFNLISDINRIPEHHYHIHLLSIPRIFYNKNDLFVSPVNFFQKKDSLEKKWTKILKKYNGIKIGINSNTSLIKKIYLLIIF